MSINGGVMPESNNFAGIGSRLARPDTVRLRRFLTAQAIAALSRR